MSMPFMAFAQTTQLVTGGTSIADKVLIGVNAVVYILMGLAVVYFVAGVIKYIAANDDATKQKAKDTMIYGIIGLFVIVSVWGLIKVLQNTVFGVGTNVSNPGATPCPPGFVTTATGGCAPPSGN